MAKKKIRTKSNAARATAVVHDDERARLRARVAQLEGELGTLISMSEEAIAAATALPNERVRLVPTEPAVGWDGRALRYQVSAGAFVTVLRTQDGDAAAASRVAEGIGDTGELVIILPHDVDPDDLIRTYRVMADADGIAPVEEPVVEEEPDPALADTLSYEDFARQLNPPQPRPGACAVCGGDLAGIPEALLSRHRGGVLAHRGCTAGHV